MLLNKWAALLLCVGLWMQSESRLAARPDDLDRTNYAPLSTPSKSCWKPLLVKAAVVGCLGAVCFVGAYQGALMALSGDKDPLPLVESLIQIPGDLSQLAFVTRTCGWQEVAYIPAPLSN